MTDLTTLDAAREKFIAAGLMLDPGRPVHGGHGPLR
jgi:hypothetical protein